MHGRGRSNGRRGYPLEFKQRALARLASGEVSLRQAAKEFQVSVPTLIKWRKEVESETSLQRPSTATASVQTASDTQLSELERLREEVARLREERDRLRLGIAYLVGVKA